MNEESLPSRHSLAHINKYLTIANICNCEYNEMSNLINIVNKKNPSKQIVASAGAYILYFYYILILYYIYILRASKNFINS